MNEAQLRTIIRKQIRRTLKEDGPSLGAAGAAFKRGLGKVKSSRVSRFSKAQKIASIAPFLDKFDLSVSDLPLIKKALVHNAKANADAAAETEAPTEENHTAGVDDGDAGASLQEAGALDSKGAKLEKTQAFQMLQKALASKPANQQAEFVMDLIGKLGMDDSAKRKLKMKVKQI